ncbi:TetR/AcrR family transcriptional regulator [Bifidobacterium eulemuris]|uniref:TetR family transcriptional regulator n=1 Tax=Bifidobacterium eulemuris TaxID=1765219 RepID=A0A261G7Z3_9BIFI|nr:TetR/AcrR family transcriptional regulator [Bifidobacterium eulemuris]OZG67542.1 TetR family transcriptional regulator [Bifidobacterium eulemuris]QOL31077.1 TetR/AcrR family transcriptional regulator [Bifidobacterium eulemuris]
MKTRDFPQKSERITMQGEHIAVSARERRPSQAREKLIRAFWRLYCTGPIDKITVREITALAGYSRATFYEYFSGVRDVLTHIEDEFFDRINAMDQSPNEAPSYEQLTAHMSDILSFAEEYQEYVAVLLSDRGDPSFSRRFKDMLKPLIEANLPAQAPRYGRERDLVCEFYASALTSTIAAWLADPGGVPLERFIVFQMNYIFRGFSLTQA